MKRNALLVIVAALVICPAAKAQKAPTLEQFLSGPFPTELTAAPAKGRVAWVFNARGARNLWVAEPSADGSYKSRQLTSFKDDDGVDLGQLAWAPDGESIVYTRSGDLEFVDGPNPNAQNAAVPIEQELWLISAAGGEPKKLAEGHNAAVSPKNGLVAYIFKK